MDVEIVTQPTLEPCTLAELKLMSGLDSGTFDGNLTLTQCLAYGSKAIANNYTTHVGTAIEVLGKQAEVLLHCGTNAATGTNDTKIQECDTLAGTYTDWAGGAFTQVTTSNDNADYKLVYTGTKRYIRTASKVLLAACEFGTSVLVNAPMVSDDSELTELITAGRLEVEKDTCKKIMRQVWNYYPKRWPDGDRIRIPFGNLQNDSTATPSTAPIVTWKDTAGTVTTMVVSTDYIVETHGEYTGFIVLPYQGSWPSSELYPSKPITITFTCGYLTTAEVPTPFKQAVKRAAVNLYMNKGDDHQGQAVIYDKTYDRQIVLCGKLYDMDYL